MSGVRAQQKQKTRQALIQAAFNQLSADHSFSNLSLREVAREAGIAPTSFYRHFKDMNELGLTMVDEAGLTLRQLMRQARRRIANDGGSVINTSVVTFMEFIDSSSNQFRLLLRERSGTSKAFRAAVAREIKHFILELAHYLESETKCDAMHAYIQSEAMVTLVFNAGAEALDIEGQQLDELVERVIWQLRYITRGATHYVRETNKVT
ncbi:MULTISPECIES: HTH-type transcriptional repressor FabR [unclassified Pseudoalteromonas]|uniref:HTH-type transcriptional repressor FabR n=2 Tax=Pseudoalteromonas TaxID=53246 RepID=UPI00073000DE|nr:MULTISPECIES: HTH-type transcriptional repressor FabR [unclassified Pseudoalteromonas]KTD98668.1 transcriptional regulator [Pseudoalteromonas sp. H71]KTF18566.1 transcriptional regulator [Pseudoalteromonas sp. 10-33]MBW4967353.1 HTH-type transcriptional repressor FabR [Pseudoalteromonas sp. CR1]TMN80972.1 HTH-type transcriptional repressor FabR [Pseudoalteromonas sp. S410]TMN87737.1 HTH-type transcriptional repressor FabR [Pseudoalteromonas sp. S408]|tara:strand:- start:146 stop:769 length:624 start_codon:yes stop_codon:yes gene_type:complete